MFQVKIICDSLMYDIRIFIELLRQKIKKLKLQKSDGLSRQRF